jgi:hypothetical protein
LYPFTRFRVTLDSRTAEEFKPINLVVWLATTIGAQFQEALFCNRCITQCDACTFFPSESRFDLLSKKLLRPQTSIIAHTSPAFPALQVASGWKQA